MRVLAMVAEYPPGRCVGSWMMTHSLLRALVDRGHDADVVLTVARGAPYELDGVRVWPARGKSDPFGFLGRSDVLLVHAESAGRALTLGDLWHVPVVRLVHNTSVLTESALKRRSAALTVFNSQHAAGVLAGHAGPSIVVRPPVRAAEYATAPGDHVTLVNVSQDKGAEVFYILAERLPEQRFLAVEGGYGVQIIDDLPNVEFLDHVPADRMRDDVYARTKILLMPSAHESWGRTGVEAMCSGIPVIASPTPGLRESLGTAGVFADPDDIDAWETELRRLLDGRRWRAASRKAKARAAELDPAQDLDRWCIAVEALAARRARTRLLVNQ